MVLREVAQNFFKDGKEARIAETDRNSPVGNQVLDFGPVAHLNDQIIHRLKRHKLMSGLQFPHIQ